MRRARRKGVAYGWLAAAMLCGLVVAPRAASARAEHHAHTYNYAPHAVVPRAWVLPPSAGFGPTSPGPSSILIDAGTGQVLAQQGADVPRYPASLTKLMTLDLAFQALADGRMSLDTRIPVSYHAASVEPVKLGLEPGSAISVRDAILAMTTMSANDAATALGEYLGGGSEARCAQMMTLRAHALGMAQTEFFNASGLPDPAQVSTARDLAILARDIVVGYPEDQKFFEVQEFNFYGHSVYSNNAMLKIYPGTTGMKTGYTLLARHNLITSAMRGGRVLIGVELHQPSWGQTYAQMTAMLDDGFGATQNPGAALAAVPPAPGTAPPLAASAPPPARVAQATVPGLLRGNHQWAAELGLFTRQVRARTEAVSVQAMQGMGFARIARLHSHGRVYWNAEVAGLTFNAAHETCTALTARGAACHVVAPPNEHLAARPDELADAGT